ncbi:hypothetical protein N9604_01520 [Candidatus Pelagibacter sp.]|nr:hypothetical protein [Candidatus Pelagibacter sp.]
MKATFTLTTHDKDDDAYCRKQDTRDMPVSYFRLNHLMFTA